MSTKIAKRVSRTELPAVSQIMEKARQLEHDGSKLVYLLRGEPDFETPAHIIKAACESMKTGRTHYPPIGGIPELRSAIANRMLYDHKIEIDPDTEVIVTTGATMGIYLAIMSIINPNDEVIIFNPIYDPYASVIRMAGGEPIWVAAEEESGHFFVPIDRIRKVITRHSKAILINNPWNPTGSVFTKQELLDLVDLAEEYNLSIITDEIYEKIIFCEQICFNLVTFRSSTRTNYHN